MFLLPRMNLNPPNPVLEMLASAARLAAADGLDTAAFMSAAWDACLDAHPGMREVLADAELRIQLKEMRKQGLIALA
jgi:hypothetical protein